EHPTNATVEFMRAGVKNRRQALIFMITNSGVGREGVCWDYHETGAKIAAGELEDDSFFSYICALDARDDPFTDPSCWPKANPSIGVTFQPKYLEERIASARGMPSMRSLVLRLNFCVWVDASNPWIDGDLWRACERPESGPLKDRWAGLDAVRERPGFVGIDLSSRLDLTAMGIVWPAHDGSLDAAIWAWTPGDTLLQREHLDRVPYSRWRDEGHIIAVDGPSIDYGHVVAHLQDMLVAGFNLPALTYDAWRIADFLREMDRLGLDGWEWDGKEQSTGVGIRLVKHGQGFTGAQSADTLWMTRSVTALEDAVLKGQLRVRKNPALTWASASAILQTDPAGNKKWEKRKSTGRIDPVVALCMAVGLARAQPATPAEDVFAERGLYFLQ
ncbi:MAG TPA: terminase TerL endonuclease subunit, partial [Longimicrobium sp.]|nr:terminase TerL endonuclease subunit [Longimicrobium sp.]